MKIAVIGTGTVGQTFASKLVSLGHKVMMGNKKCSTKIRRKREGYVWQSTF
jgi:predicted dinucleotide-binding enzyme